MGGLVNRSRYGGLTQTTDQLAQQRAAIDTTKRAEHDAMVRSILADQQAQRDAAGPALPKPPDQMDAYLQALQRATTDSQLRKGTSNAFAAGPLGPRSTTGSY